MRKDVQTGLPAIYDQLLPSRLVLQEVHERDEFVEKWWKSTLLQGRAAGSNALVAKDTWEVPDDR